MLNQPGKYIESSLGDGNGHVRVHPFTDGNGRKTRLLADLVFAAAQDFETPDQYDWQLDKRRYIDLLRQYDGHRDPTELAIFIGTTPLGQ